MKHKVLVNLNELYVGMRVKCPIAGWWCGYPHKKQLWFKGIITQIGNNCVIINLKSRRYPSIGRTIFPGNQMENSIYKVL